MQLMKLIYWHKSQCFSCDLPSSEAAPLQTSLRFLRFVFFSSSSPLVCCFSPPLPFPFSFLHQNVAGLNHTRCCFHRECAFLSPALPLWLLAASVTFKSALKKWTKRPRHVRRPTHTKRHSWVSQLKRCKHLAEIKVRHKICSWSEGRLRFQSPTLIGAPLHFSVFPPSRHPLHEGPGG